MDSFRANQERTTIQWDLYHKIMKEQCLLPVKSVIGNHDVWGWDKNRSQTTGSEALWGKKKSNPRIKNSGVDTIVSIRPAGILLFWIPHSQMATMVTLQSWMMNKCSGFRTI